MPANTAQALVDAAISAARTGSAPGPEEAPPPAPPVPASDSVPEVGPPVAAEPGELIDANGNPVDPASIWVQRTAAGHVVVARISVYRWQQLPGSTQRTAVQVVAAGTEVPKDAALRLVRR